MSPPPLEISQSLKISSKAQQEGFLVRLSYFSVSPQPKPKANSLKSSPLFQIRDFSFKQAILLVVMRLVRDGSLSAHKWLLSQRQSSRSTRRMQAMRLANYHLLSASVQLILLLDSSLRPANSGRAQRVARSADELAQRVDNFYTSPILPISPEIEMEGSLNAQNWDTEY